MSVFMSVFMSSNQTFLDQAKVSARRKYAQMQLQKNTNSYHDDALVTYQQAATAQTEAEVVACLNAAHYYATAADLDQNEEHNDFEVKKTYKDIQYLILAANTAKRIAQLQALIAKLTDKEYAAGIFKPVLESQTEHLNQLTAKLTKRAKTLFSQQQSTQIGDDVILNDDDESAVSPKNSEIQDIKDYINGNSYINKHQLSPTPNNAATWQEKTTRHLGLGGERTSIDGKDYYLPKRVAAVMSYFSYLLLTDGFDNLTLQDVKNQVEALLTGVDLATSNKHSFWRKPETQAAYKPSDRSDNCYKQQAKSLGKQIDPAGSSISVVKYLQQAQRYYSYASKLYQLANDNDFAAVKYLQDIQYLEKAAKCFERSAKLVAVIEKSHSADPSLRKVLASQAKHAANLLANLSSSVRFSISALQAEANFSQDTQTELLKTDLPNKPLVIDPEQQFIDLYVKSKTTSQTAHQDISKYQVDAGKFWAYRKTKFHEDNPLLQFLKVLDEKKFYPTAINAGYWQKNTTRFFGCGGEKIEIGNKTYYVPKRIQAIMSYVQAVLAIGDFSRENISAVFKQIHALQSGTDVKSSKSNSFWRNESVQSVYDQCKELQLPVQEQARNVSNRR